MTPIAITPLPATVLHDKPSAHHAALVDEATELLRAAVAEFGAAHITQASSLGAEDMVITHLAQSAGLGIPLFVLQTGALHPETLQLLAELQADPGLSVSVYEPDAAHVADFVAREGQDAMYRSIALRKECCRIRKLEPLARALQDKAAWITGLRREQSDARSDVHLRDDSEVPAGKPVKLSPLANWTWGDVWHYIATHHVPYNPLHDQFFPSIGCAPCTRAITLGEDFRSGRWWWEDDQARECGLHVHADTAPAAGHAPASPLPGASHA